MNEAAGMGGARLIAADPDREYVLHTDPRPAEAAHKEAADAEAAAGAAGGSGDAGGEKAEGLDIAFEVEESGEE
jgi:hypothetical protein